MDYTVDRDDHLGRHIVFARPVVEGNFIEACNVAIALASKLASEELAVNFKAKGVGVQVVRSDSAEVQFALWQRRLPTSRALRSTTLVFVRHEGAKVSTVAFLTVRTTLDTDEEVKAALAAATTHWVNSTDAGRHLWDYSFADLNIGDLHSGSAFQDKGFLAALWERGIEYVDCLAMGCDDAIPYDQVLVNAGDLVDAAAGSP